MQEPLTSGLGDRVAVFCQACSCDTFQKPLAELLFELISQRYECGSTSITSNLPFYEWTETFGTERLTGALLDRLTHHVNILEMSGDSYRLGQSRARKVEAST